MVKAKGRLIFLLTACLEEDSSSSKKESQKAENSIPEIELPEDEF